MDLVGKSKYPKAKFQLDNNKKQDSKLMMIWNKK